MEKREQKQMAECLKLADELERLEMECSQGRGITYVHWIVEDLRRGDLEAAKTNYRQQSDKYGSLPQILKFLEDIGIAESRWLARAKESQKKPKGLNDPNL